MQLEPVFTAVAVAFEVVGATAMVVGAVIAVVLAARSFGRREGGRAAFMVLRTSGASSLVRALRSDEAGVPH